MKIPEFKKDIVYRTLRGEIIQGKYPFNFKFPKELDLAAKLGVAKVTLRSALVKLESEGLIARLPARGTYVTYKAGNDNGRILVLPTHMDKFESPSIYILPGVLARAVEAGRETITCEVDFLNGFSRNNQREFALKNNISGSVVLASGFNGNEPLIDMLRQMNIPVVLPHGGIHDRVKTGFAVVRNDYKASWRMAVTHLVSNGHKNIGSILLNAKDIRTYDQEEYLGLLHRCGARNHKSMIAYASYSEKDVENAVHELLAKAEFPPTAILCFSDFIAIYVYEALKKINVKIPHDIAVMGYCGYPGSGLLSPPLSTIDLQYFKAGATAVDVLLRSSEWFGPGARAAAPEVIMPHILKDRESTNIKRMEEILMITEAV
ncbi:MAG: hypothetical protein A2020_00500 [Lentisphaerae bacterium GWF2_45_14]|nr:MAG: hypothetical protein A2020_00500 [Lentisphaerae bacterium GWF2_45_14]